MKYIGSYPQYNNYGTAYNNAVPIGGYGYNTNNGYYSYPYNNGYYGYPSYDPLEIRRQQEEEYERQQKIRQGEIDSMKKMIEVNYHFFGKEIDKEELDRTFSDENLAEIQRDFNEHATMYYLQQSVNQQIAQQKAYEEQRKNMVYPTEVKDESLLEFLEGSGRNDYIQAVEDEWMRQSRQAIGQSYDHPGYEELLRIHNANKFLNPQVTIEDMSIGLPEHLKTEKNLRRQQFLESIMKGTPNGGVL